MNTCNYATPQEEFWAGEFGSGLPPVTISYRGHADHLFKRDLAGELLEKYHVNLVDYGFAYRRVPAFPQDDITWFLLEKK